MTSREFADRLARRARRAGVSVSPTITPRLELYFQLLARWNAKINLTGADLTDPTPEAIDRLLIEPLVAAKYVSPEARRAIDIGSGGGSPAIPLALCLPQLSVLMVESKTRKSVFLREAVRTLGLSGAEVAASRFEALLARPDLYEAHDLLTIRAVRVEPSTLNSLQAFIKPGGQLFLFQAASGDDAPGLSTAPFVSSSTHQLAESLGSHLMVLTKRMTRTRAHVPRGT